MQPGGRHPGRTSHNALVVFEDGAYLELIAWPEPGPAERWYNELQAHGEGLMDFALIPDDVPRAVADAKARGLALSGPIDGGRMRPDGREVKWRTGRQQTFDLPFLCGDVTPRDLRVPTGDVRRHANHATGIATVVVAVTDLDASLARYEKLLGLGAGTSAHPVAMPGLGATTATIDLGECAILLLRPTGGGPPASHLVECASARLALRGEGPCALALRASEGVRKILDETSTHAVLMEIGD